MLHLKDSQKLLDKLSGKFPSKQWYICIISVRSDAAVTVAYTAASKSGVFLRQASTCEESGNEKMDSKQPSISKEINYSSTAITWRDT